MFVSHSGKYIVSVNVKSVLVDGVRSSVLNSDCSRLQL